MRFLLLLLFPLTAQAFPWSDTYWKGQFIQAADPEHGLEWVVWDDNKDGWLVGVQVNRAPNFGEFFYYSPAIGKIGDGMWELTDFGRVEGSVDWVNNKNWALVSTREESYYYNVATGQRKEIPEPTTVALLAPLGMIPLGRRFLKARRRDTACR